MAATIAMPTRHSRTNRDRVLITPEGVALPITLASRGSRAGALMLDFLLLGTAFVVVTIALISLAGGVASVMGRFDGGGGSAPAALQFLVVAWIIMTFMVRYAWFLWFELGARGATPGKRLVGIRIAARDGGRLTPEMVIARNLLRDIELFLPIAFIASAGADSTPAWLAATAWFAMFMLFPCFNRDRLRAGDVIAGTWVVEAPRRKLEAAMSLPQPAAAEAQYRFTDAELAVYGEYELQTLERVLREGQAPAIESVQATIAAKIGRDPWVPESRAFLEAYYAQLRARLETGMRMGKRKVDKFSGGA
jgi:uncharacterized RDD family membrane protein YckC